MGSCESTGRELSFEWSHTLSLPNVAKGKFRPKFHISFSKILRKKWHHVKVQAESFHLNGHLTKPHQTISQ